MQAKKAGLKIRPLLEQILPILMCAFIIAAVIGAVSSVSEENNRLGTETVKNSVTKCLISCYAAEGMYPSDISYLEENYGLLINHDVYAVYLNSFASNIMPTVAVIAKSGIMEFDGQ